MNKTLFALCLCAALALTLLTGCVWRGIGGSEVASAPLRGDEIAVMLHDAGSLCSDPGVVIDGGTIRITRGGDYVFTGVLSGGQVCVDAPEDAAVRLVFGGVHLVKRGGPAILAQSAGSLVLAALPETSNLIQSADGGAAVDAACDLRFTGGGALNLSSLTGRAAVSEGAITLEGGTVNLEAAGDGLWSAGSLTVEGGGLNADVVGNGISGLTVNVSGGLLNFMAQADGLPLPNIDSRENNHRPNSFFALYMPSVARSVADIQAPFRLRKEPIFKKFSDTGSCFSSKRDRAIIVPAFTLRR